LTLWLHVRFTPNSDRGSDTPADREVPALDIPRGLRCRR
jgi:hypothetical protein